MRLESLAHSITPATIVAVITTLIPGQRLILHIFNPFFGKICIITLTGKPGAWAWTIKLCIIMIKVSFRVTDT